MEPKWHVNAEPSFKHASLCFLLYEASLAALPEALAIGRPSAQELSPIEMKIEYVCHPAPIVLHYPCREPY
jgi:hypothetical protein